MAEFLMKGDYGNDVEGLQEFLWDNGFVGAGNPFWKSYIAKKNNIIDPNDRRAKKFWIDKDFGTWTEGAVADMQLTLLGPRKIPLDEISKPGIVCLNTRWAIDNFKTEHQTQDVTVPNIVTKQDSLGLTIAKVFSHYWSLGIKEPKGINRGPYVPSLWPGVKYGGIDFWIGYDPKKPSTIGPPWCCFGRIGIEYEAHGLYFGKGGYINSNGRIGLCYNNYKWAIKQNEILLSNEYDKRPEATSVTDYDFDGWVIPKELVMQGIVKLPVGAAMIMKYGNGLSGHTGSVMKTVYKGVKAVEIYCFECNAGNKLDIKRRSLDQSSIRWFIVSPLLLRHNPDFKGIDVKDLKLSDGKDNTR